MAAAIRLRDFSTAPLYNIKAVVQATQVSPSTLRAWERRYNMCRPGRSDSGYRLYSDRDVAIIRWLKTQVDAGVSISQAVAWLQTLVDEATTVDQTTLPDSGSRTAEISSPISGMRLDLQPCERLHLQLLDALLSYDEGAAERSLANAFALYSIEHVGEHVIMPVMIEIGERWHHGELNITREHFATSYVLQRLAAILRTAPNVAGRPLIWIGCAPGERHEIGALLLAVYLRRAGYTVHYLGQDLSGNDLVQEVKSQQPDLVVLSATCTEASANLKQLCQLLADIGPSRPIIGYGGSAFNLNPELRNVIAGIFLGVTALEAVDTVGKLLAERPRLNGQVWRETGFRS